jgi:hypothetical protein
MQRNILLLTIGTLTGAVAVVGSFYLSYWLFYFFVNGASEDVSVLSLIAIFLIAIILSIFKKYRYFGLGMVVGCILGFVVLLTQLWGA